MLRHCVEAARRREEIKECLPTVYHYQEGSFVDHQTYKPYTLVGPPALRLVLDPLAVIFLDNRLYMLNHIHPQLLAPIPHIARCGCMPPGTLHANQGKHSVPWLQCKKNC